MRTISEIGKTLLIGKGFLGTKLLKVFSDKNVSIASAGIEWGCNAVCDITKRAPTINLIKKLKPENLILTASTSNVDFCETHPKEAYKVNVKGVKNAAEACDKIKCKLVFLSTDYVFDGNKGNYKENSPINPVNYYGKTKVQAEKIARSLPDHLIIRTSTLYGFNSIDDKNTFARFVVQKLSEGSNIYITSQITSPTFIDGLSLSIYSLLEKNCNGTYHCVGSEAISRLDFARRISKVFGLDSSKIIFSERIPGEIAKRPQNSSLNISKLKKQKIRMAGTNEGLKNLKKEVSGAWNK
ncbi:MAG: NAD(P)-dependent oxidoreductase [Candidatus Diapherotrites archaeon]